MPITFDSVSSVIASVGRDLGHTEWRAIEQSRVNQFAEATGDNNWIHVDPKRAAEGPFGACVAHGYLVMSLSAYFLFRLVRCENLLTSLNYGCEKVRFPHPVRVGSRVRGHAMVLGAELVGAAAQVIFRMTIEVEGASKPACVVDMVIRYYFD